MNANIQSIYIPRMSKATTEDKIRQVMHNYCVGSVSYIDFTCVNKKPGFIEDDNDDKFKSAFIHFDKSRQFAHLSSEYTMFWDKIERGETCKLFVGRNDAISTHTHEYWMCFKNKNPIPRTQMNIHQVVEAGRYLEKAHNGLVETVLEQKGKIEELEKKLMGVQNLDKNENTNILEKLERKLYADYLKHQNDIKEYKKNIEHFKEQEWYEEKELEEEKVCNSKESIRQIQEIYEEVSGQNFDTLIEKFSGQKFESLQHKIEYSRIGAISNEFEEMLSKYDYGSDEKREFLKKIVSEIQKYKLYLNSLN